MGIYLLKDTSYDDETSKINNFSRQWLKWYPCAKIIFPNVKIQDDDIVIVNLYNDVIYGKYEIPKKAKKLYIVHRLNEQTIGYIENDADFVIYLNALSKQIVEDIGCIKKPCMVAPRHPMPEFRTEARKKNVMYVGGWFTPEKTEGLVEKLLLLHEKMDEKCKFGLFPIWGKITTNLQVVRDITDKLKSNSHKFGDRIIFINEDEMTYDMMNYKMRMCSHIFLWDNGPSTGKIRDLLDAKDPNILSYNIEESSMLAIAQATGNTVIAEDKIKFLPYFDAKSANYTYQNFAQLIKQVLPKIKS